MIYDNKRNDMVESGDWLYCIDVMLMIFIMRSAPTWKGVGHILRKLELLLLVEKPVTSKGWSNVKIVKGVVKCERYQRYMTRNLYIS